MKSKCLNKKQFIAVMDALMKQYDKDERIEQFFAKEMNDGFITLYELHSDVVNCLKQILCDSFSGEVAMFDIDYFIHELDFGRKYKKGMASDGNGNEIDMSSAEKMWDHLTEL